MLIQMEIQVYRRTCDYKMRYLHELLTLFLFLEFITY